MPRQEKCGGSGTHPFRILPRIGSTTRHKFSTSFWWLRSLARSAMFVSTMNSERQLALPRGGDRPPDAAASRSTVPPQKEVVSGPIPRTWAQSRGLSALSGLPFGKAKGTAHLLRSPAAALRLLPPSRS